MSVSIPSEPSFFKMNRWENGDKIMKGNGQVPKLTLSSQLSRCMVYTLEHLNVSYGAIIIELNYFQMKFHCIVSN